MVFKMPLFHHNMQTAHVHNNMSGSLYFKHVPSFQSHINLDVLLNLGLMLLHPIVAFLYLHHLD